MQMSRESRYRGGAENVSTEMAAKYQASLQVPSLFGARRTAPPCLTNPSPIFRNRSLVPRSVSALPQCSSVHLLMCRMSHPQVQDVQTYAPQCHLTQHWEGLPMQGFPPWCHCRSKRMHAHAAMAQLFHVASTAVGGFCDKIQFGCHGGSRSRCRGETKDSKCSRKRNEPRIEGRQVGMRTRRRKRIPQQQVVLRHAAPKASATGAAGFAISALGARQGIDCRSDTLRANGAEPIGMTFGHTRR